MNTPSVAGARGHSSGRPTSGVSTVPLAQTAEATARDPARYRSRHTEKLETHPRFRFRSLPLYVDEPGTQLGSASNVRLIEEHFCEVNLLASDGRKIFDRFMQMRSKAQAMGNFGDGTIIYDGIQGLDSDIISVWRFSLYGDVKLVDPGEDAVQIGAFTGPKRMVERTELYAKWAAGKGPWLSPAS